MFKSLRRLHCWATRPWRQLARYERKTADLTEFVRIQDAVIREKDSVIGHAAHMLTMHNQRLQEVVLDYERQLAAQRMVNRDLLWLRGVRKENAES